MYAWMFFGYLSIYTTVRSSIRISWSYLPTHPLQHKSNRSLKLHLLLLLCVHLVLSFQQLMRSIFTHPDVDVDVMATQVVGNANSLSFIEVDLAGMVRM